MTERLFRASVRIVLRCMFGCLGGVSVIGMDRMPRTGGIVIAPNHLSHADPMLIGMVVDRPVWFVATDELFEIPVLGSLARWLRAFPIRQDSADRGALRKLEGLLGAGEGVVAFPEGHESLDGHLQPLQPGVVWVALRAQAPIVPVGIRGTERMLPPCEWRLRHAGARITVCVGEPISPLRLSGGMRGRAAAEHGCDVLRSALLELTCDGASNPVCGGQPG
ncbi:MAG: 1-acyl-sn-glycerol-3-phosphate acyltransferase [Armatimonadetes bacterium]|nr:1-acyl-sn-glycerol-3-phosphate acyltransferase [Armatimonadota bacterium]